MVKLTLPTKHPNLVKNSNEVNEQANMKGKKKAGLSEELFIVG